MYARVLGQVAEVRPVCLKRPVRVQAPSTESWECRCHETHFPAEDFLVIRARDTLRALEVMYHSCQEDNLMYEGMLILVFPFLLEKECFCVHSSGKDR